MHSLLEGARSYCCAIARYGLGSGPIHMDESDVQEMKHP